MLATPVKGTDVLVALFLKGGLITWQRSIQSFQLTTAISDSWGVELGYRVKHEFEPQPGVEATDSRLDFSIVREF